MRFWLLALVLVAGCASPQVVKDPQTGGAAPELTADSFWEEQAFRRKEVAAVTAKVRVTYHGKQKKVSGNGRILIQPGDQLRLELRDPLGRVQYLALLNGRAFTAYYPRQKLAYLDEKAGAAYTLDFLGMDFNFGELHSLTLGVLPERFANGKMDAWSLDPKTKQYQGLLTAGDYRIHVFVDPRSAALRALELDSPAGRVRVDYSGYEPCCHGISNPGVQLAHVVDLKLDRQKTALALEWERISLVEQLQPAQSFVVELDDKDQKIKLK